MGISSSLADVCRFNPTLGGTTDWTYSSAVTGYQSPTAAAMVVGAQYSYRAESSDLTQWELGVGIWSGTVLSRVTVLFNSAGTTAKIAFSAAPQVAIVALAEDLRPLCDPPQGRLTLLSGTPVMTASQSSKGTLYYTPYQGNSVPIYDGSNFVMASFPEISVATSDTTKNPAAIGAGKVNDWFIWNDAGTPRLSHGPDWTSDTARSAGTALTLVNGIYLNSVAITNGPAASRGTYVGTTRADAGAGTLSFIFGSSAVGGGSAWFGVWNMYNRVSIPSGIVTDSTGSWTYGTATFRATNNQNGMRISAVFGQVEDAINAAFSCYMTNGAASAGVIGVGLNTTSGNSGTATGGQAVNTSAPLTSLLSAFPSSAGFNFVQAVEYAAGTGNVTFYGSNSIPAVYGNSLTATLRM